MITLPFSQWADTAHVLHMTLQMMGKTKLLKMAAQPEWNHTLLYLNASGFTTGLIPDGPYSFEVTFDIAQSRVEARCTTGQVAAFPIHGAQTISGVYARYLGLLAQIGHPIAINPAPQEVANLTPFDQQHDTLHYRPDHAHIYFDNAMFAHNALLAFAAPLRNKKILPSLFWGTFDLTTVLFAGVDKPFPGKGLIEKVAFDEQFVEYGFWPGDQGVQDASFFVLPYPFLEKDLTGSPVAPREAFYSPEKKEFFLKLSDVLRKDDPMETVLAFCRDTFDLIAREENWAQVDWFTKPLLC